MRIAVLVKQIPGFDKMELGADGRLTRDGLPLELNAYCRRAVSKGIELARARGGTCTAFTLGPPCAEDALREAIAGGVDRGVLITDPAFAGSDTLATARALAAALQREGPFDLVLAGRNSVDSDTGQVPPELAQILGYACATGVRELEMVGDHCRVRCEHDDEWVEATVSLPAVLTCAERLCDPTKCPPEQRSAVSAEHIHRLSAADLGEGPWGQDGSPTWVGEVRTLHVERRRTVLGGPVAEQVAAAVGILEERGSLDQDRADEKRRPVPETSSDASAVIAVVVEPNRSRVTREILGAAARLAGNIRGRVTALAPAGPLDEPLGTWGADALVAIEGAGAEEDVASALTEWADETRPWAILLPSTAWGREVASRTAAALGAGLTGDAIDLEVDDERLVAWKPAFGGATVAAIRCSSAIQMATVRAGVLPVDEPRVQRELPLSSIGVDAAGRVEILSRVRDDDGSWVSHVEYVVSVGLGVPPGAYGDLNGLLELLDAELIATRKVTDRGHLPRARQVGITGHSIAPRLCIVIGSSGKFNHMAGLRQAETIVAINPDPEAFVWQFADVGIVAPWEEAVPLLHDRLTELLAGR